MNENNRHKNDDNCLSELEALLRESGVPMNDMAQDATEKSKSAMDAADAPKTKRGRKPKAESKEVAADAPKSKRGRKPKANPQEKAVQEVAEKAEV